MSECELRVRMEIKAAQFWASASAGCFLRAGQVLPVRAVVEFWRSASVPLPKVLLGTAKVVSTATAPNSEERSPSHQQPRQSSTELHAQTPLSVGPTEIEDGIAYACALGRLTPPNQPSLPASKASDFGATFQAWSRTKTTDAARCYATGLFQGPKVREAPQPRVPSPSLRLMLTCIVHVLVAAGSHPAYHGITRSILIQVLVLCCSSSSPLLSSARLTIW